MDVNKTDYIGATALHYAIVYGNVESTRLLLCHPDIDVSIKPDRSYPGSFRLVGNKTPIELVDLVYIHYGFEVQNQMRHLFGLPPTPPPPPQESLEIQMPTEPKEDKTMKRKILIGASWVGFVIVIGSALGVWQGLK